MYNEDRKTRFMDETKSTQEFGRFVFNTTQPYEHSAGQDLCELPSDVLQEIANKYFGARTRSVDNTISYIRSYVVWCKAKGYPTCDGIYSVKTQMDEKMKRYMVASPRHLQAILDKVFSPVESGTIDCVYRCYLWLLFAGLEEADATEVKTGEIDFNSMLIEHGGKSFELYREAIPAFRMACEATQFQFIHPRYTQTRNRYLGDNLMRGIRSESMKPTTIRSVIQKAFKSNGIDLTYSTIRLSGMFYRAYEMERMGKEINFDDYIAEQIIKRNSTYHINYTRNKAANMIKRDLLDDYACWKAAFT